MTPELLILFTILVAVAVGVVAWQLQRGHPVDWPRRYKRATLSLVGFSLCWLAIWIIKLADKRPFWPREAFSVFCFTVLLGCLFYTWRQAKRKAAEETARIPTPPKHGNPLFMWQATFILLPVVGLACFGLYSLRQDRLLAEQEARESGGILAQRLAQAISTEAVQQLRDYREASVALRANRETDLGLSGWAGGAQSESNAWQRIKAWQQANPEIDLFSLPPVDANSYWEEKPESVPPQPPDWLSQLNPEQHELWQAAQQAEFNGRDYSVAQAALERFIASKPSKGARANAEYLLLLTKTHGMAANEAVSQIAEFSRSHWGNSSERTDAGLPLGQLICYQALKRLPDGAGLPENFIRHSTVAWMIGYSPSIFSAVLISETARVTRGTAQEQYATTLRAWWSAEAAARNVYQCFREQHPTNTWKTAAFWVNSSLGKYLLILGDRQVAPTNWAARSERYAYLMFPQVVVEKALATAVSKSDISEPSYAVADFEFGGEKIALSRNKTAARPNETLSLLGRAGGMFEKLPLNAHAYPFQVRVFLASPEILYARQRQRTWMFGALIVASLFAAMLGLFAAYRSFRRQLELNEMKSNFVSSVSHELRAPIASVRLMAESLERGKVAEPQRQREYFKLIGQESRRLSSLIGNVLDFARIEQGRKQYEFEPTDLLALTRETVKLMEPNAAEKGVRLEFNSELGTHKPELDIDARAIQQALINLIDNAVKHSPKGQTVTVGLGVSESRVPNSASHGDSSNPQGTTLNLSVTDRGPGIPSCEHEHIFERFYRRGSELRRETQGVGIGLSIVKHIVEAHDGRVRVESEVGKGSRFVIELPTRQSKPQIDTDEDR